MASAMKVSVLPSRSSLAPIKQSRVAKCRAAADRPVWCPGLKPPKHLKGELVGDFGYDPLGLGQNPDALRWFVQSEIFHGRVAMMGLAGMLIPSALTKAGFLNVPEWYEAGKVVNDSSNIPFTALLMVELFLCGWVETRRWMDFRKPECLNEPGSFIGLGKLFYGGSGECAYPGGIFDPLNFGSGDSLDSLKLRELKNGRLAMVATLGFFAQYAATGKGPVDNLLDHINDPWANNFTTNGVSLPFL